MHIFKCAFVAVTLCACNSVYVKPNSLDASQTVYADRGGYSMRRSIKHRMTDRGYNVIVGTAHATDMRSDSGEDIELNTTIVPKTARYVVKVSERREKFNPFWCPFNGFWWWNFNASIADQETGEEIMTWRGRGCANSTLRKLDKILDEMEIQNAN